MLVSLEVENNLKGVKPSLIVKRGNGLKLYDLVDGTSVDLPEIPTDYETFDRLAKEITAAMKAEILRSAYPNYSSMIKHNDVAIELVHLRGPGELANWFWWSGHRNYLPGQSLAP